jgi:hypothetical protein
MQVNASPAKMRSAPRAAESAVEAIAPITEESPEWREAKRAITAPGDQTAKMLHDVTKNSPGIE